MRLIHASILLACLTGTAHAQKIVHESLTASPWNHTSSGTWKNAILEARSSFGVVDHLVSASAFSYTRGAVTLDPGTYLAVVRFGKMTTTTGAAPIRLNMIIPFSQTTTIPVSEQKVDTLIHSRAMTFNLKNKTSVLFSLSNTDTSTTKSDYYFDDFYLGKIAEGPVELIESLGRRWTHSHGAPHYLEEVADATATFGFVESLGPRSGAGLWWFDWTSSVKQFSPGLKTFNIRLKKTVDLGGYYDFDLWVAESTDGGATWNAGSKTTWLRTSHIVDKWIESPNITFKVSSASNLYRFYFHSIGGAAKFNYYFDSFTVRKGEFTPFGSSCVKNGAAVMSGTIPQLGYPFEIKVGPLSNTTPMVLMLGLTQMNFDLAALGWPGCHQYASMDVTAPMPVLRGAARITITVPTTPVLIGIPFYTQAYKPSPTGTIKTSNGIQAEIGG